MPKRSEVVENLNWVTERISDRVWTIAVGVVAVSLTYIIESTKAGGSPFLEPRQVAVPAALALLALVGDLVQYMAANRQNVQLLQKMEAEGLDEAKFVVGSPLMRIRIFAYRAKLWLSVTAVLWIVFLSTQRALELIRAEVP